MINRQLKTDSKNSGAQSGNNIRLYFDEESARHSDWHDFDSIQFVLLSCRRLRAQRSR